MATVYSFKSQKVFASGTKLIVFPYITILSTDDLTNSTTLKIEAKYGRSEAGGATSGGTEGKNWIKVTVNGTTYEASLADSGSKYNYYYAGTDFDLLPTRTIKDSVILQHDAEGKLTLSISIEAAIGNDRYHVPQTSLNCNEINNLIPRTTRATQITAHPGTIGETKSFAIDFTRYAPSGNVEDVITWSVNNHSGQVDDLVTSLSSQTENYTLNIDGEMLAVLESFTNVNQFNITFTCITYLHTSGSRGSMLGSSTSIVTAYFPDYSEQIEITPTITEATQKILDLQEKKKQTLAHFLQNSSTLDCQIQATTLYNASISSCMITVDSQHYICNQVGQRWAIVTSTPLRTVTDELIVTIEVTDSRSMSKTIRYRTGKAVKSYTPPVLERVMSLRCDGSRVEYYKGAYVLLYFNAIIDKLNGTDGTNINSADYSVSWRSTNIETVISDSWNMEPDEDLYDREHGWNATTDENAVFFKLHKSGAEDEDTTEYDITLTVKDELSEVSYTVHSNTGDRLIHWAADGLHMAFCKMCKEEPLAYVEFGKEASFDKGYLPARVPVKNLNNVFSPGIYSCYDANTDQVVLSNKPFGANARFSLEVRQTDENEYMQTAEWLTESGRQAQSRYYRNEVWSDWATSSGSSGGGGGSGGTTDIDDLLPTDVEREKLVSLVMKQMIDAMYPIGSIYIATSVNANPNTLFRGTGWSTEWEKIEGVFLLGSSTSYSLGSGGGSASTSINVSHRHNTGAGIDTTGVINVNIEDIITSGKGRPFGLAAGKEAGRLDHDVMLATTSTTNLTRTINTMPPYRVVDIWQRTK